MQFKSILLSLTILSAAFVNAAPANDASTGFIDPLLNLASPALGEGSQSYGNPGSPGVLNPSANVVGNAVASGNTVDALPVLGVLSKIYSVPSGLSQSASTQNDNGAEGGEKNSEKEEA